MAMAIVLLRWMNLETLSTVIKSCLSVLNTWQKKSIEKDTIVTTVMSNLGFHKAVEGIGLKDVVTQVGDRYVVEEMRKNDYNFGGEQSGHMIFLDFNTTGDGMLSGIQLLNIMKQTGKKLSELAAEVTIYPQKLVNIRVSDKTVRWMFRQSKSD